MGYFVSENKDREVPTIDYLREINQHPVVQEGYKQLQTIRTWQRKQQTEFNSRLARDVADANSVMASALEGKVIDFSHMLSSSPVSLQEEEPVEDESIDRDAKKSKKKKSKKKNPKKKKKIQKNRNDYSFKGWF